MAGIHLFYLLFTDAYAWWCTGHMMTAMVANLDLAVNQETALSQAVTTVAVLNGALTHNISNSFVESACWADDIKEYNVQDFDNYHFLDKPYNPQGLLNATASGPDVLGALFNILSTLSKETYITAPLETSTSLRFMIHILGDMHQPLHCTNMWDASFPNGDQGGNLFKIVYQNITELHAFWDSGAGYWQQDYQRPLSPADRQAIELQAEKIMTEWPRSRLQTELAKKDPSSWCLESYLDAVNYAYNGIQPGQTLSNGYVARAWDVVKKRIALGGYRLSDLISELY